MSRDTIIVNGGSGYQPWSWPGSGISVELPHESQPRLYPHCAAMVSEPREHCPAQIYAW